MKRNNSIEITSEMDIITARKTLFALAKSFVNNAIKCKKAVVDSFSPKAIEASRNLKEKYPGGIMHNNSFDSLIPNFEPYRRVFTIYEKRIFEYGILHDNLQKDYETAVNNYLKYFGTDEFLAELKKVADRYKTEN